MTETNIIGDDSFLADGKINNSFETQRKEAEKRRDDWCQLNYKARLEENMKNGTTYKFYGGSTGKQFTIPPVEENIPELMLPTRDKDGKIGQEYSNCNNFIGDLLESRGWFVQGWHPTSTKVILDSRVDEAIFM